MSKPKITIESWKHVARELTLLNSNTEIIEAISEIGKKLEIDNEDYVYCLSFNYGNRIIDKGELIKFNSETYDLIAGDYNVNFRKFLEDISYSTDPLGIVLSNHVEVYTENDCTLNRAKETYLVPLNVIHSGDAFGVFGTLDFLLSDLSNRMAKKDWHMVAGNASFHLASAFNNQIEKDNIIGNDAYKLFEEDKPDFPFDNRCRFIQEYAGDWFVKVALIPKQFLTLRDSLGQRLEHALLKKGWNQSSTLRSRVFEEVIFTKGLRKKEATESFKHDERFLTMLCNYLIGASKGENVVLRPLLDEGHIINQALSKFRESNSRYFDLKKSYEPIPFIYETLKEKENWGILPLRYLPIVHPYFIASLSKLISDLNTIRKYDESIPDLNGFISRGNSDGIVEDNKILKESFLIPLLETQLGSKLKKWVKAESKEQNLNIYKEKISLSSKAFSNLIFLKRA